MARWMSLRSRDCTDDGSPDSTAFREVASFSVMCTAPTVPCPGFLRCSAHFLYTCARVNS